MSWLRFRTGSSRGNEDLPLAIERLEDRTLLNASASLAAGVLTILGTGNDRINVAQNNGQLQVLDNGQPIGQFASASVGQITVQTGTGFNIVRINNDVLQPALIQGGPGNNAFYAGGGPTQLIGGSGQNKLIGGPNTTILQGGGPTHFFGGVGQDTFISGAGPNLLFNVKANDTVLAGPSDKIVADQPPPDPNAPTSQLLGPEVEQLLNRAAAASSNNGAIIVVTDRGGQILGVRVENGVDPAITANNSTLTFAIDGAAALARSAGDFSSNQGPLTSRTVQFVSQTTMTQREVESNPSIPDLTSPFFGPGFVAPVGANGHFPPGVPFTPQVDLFNIETINRDSILHTGANNIRLDAATDIPLPSRFNVPTQFVPAGINNPTPESYGFNAFAPTDPAHFAQARGIGTLPGGVPIYKNGNLVGGIGVFFPGKTGFATEENSALSETFNPAKPDLAQLAEWMAFAAVGGSAQAGAPVGALAGIAPVPGINLPFGRIDLVGITFPLYGPGNPQNGVTFLLNFGAQQGVGNPAAGVDEPLNTGGATLLNGNAVSDGNLVIPHDGAEPTGPKLTAADVNQIINAAINQANLTRAAIRLPLGTRTKNVFAITDTQGNVLGLFRQSDATYEAIAVSVAAARNVAYYDNPALLQPIDQVPGVPPGAALTGRTFRYLAQPRFPEGIDGQPPGPFSILNVGGAGLETGLNTGPPLPGTAFFNNVQGVSDFVPQANFHDPLNIANQNGTILFPDAIPLYKPDANGHMVLVGGLGVSGDGVDQRDVISAAAAGFFQAPTQIQADQFFFDNVRLPYQKNDRNPEG